MYQVDIQSSAEVVQVRSIRNQFLGVNPHLHSYYQALGGWGRFHTPYLVNLTYTLKARLLSMGYTAELEPSLQIRRIDADEVNDPEADVTIYDLDPIRVISPYPTPAPSSPTTAGELVLSIAEAIPGSQLSTKPYQAVNIYEWRPGKLDRGKPVAWIELLSPTNKPGHSDARQYLEKRSKVIQSGTVYVEIDFLHETAPTISPRS